MCYHAEFGRSTSKGVNINRGEAKNWERQASPLGMGSVVQGGSRTSCTSVSIEMKPVPDCPCRD